MNNPDVLLENACKEKSMEEKGNIYSSLLLFQEHQKEPPQLTNSGQNSIKLV